MNHPYEASRQPYATVSGALEAVARDVAQGWRGLSRSPGFFLVVVVTLALGIGANVAMFSVVRSVLWRPLPYPEAERIVVVKVSTGAVSDAGASHGELQDLREQSRLLERISTAFGVDAHVSVGGNVRRVAAASVSDDLLPLLGAPVALGRTLQAEHDDAPGRMRVVISDDLWRRQFAGDPAVLGRQVEINNAPMEIVGVLRPGLQVFLRPSTNAAEAIDVWFPTNIGRSRRARGAEVLARLRPGVTLPQAQAELDALAARFVNDHASDYPDGTLRLTVAPLREALTEKVELVLAALAGAVAFVLLIACVNVANLILARNSARQADFAVRRALGASRVSLVRQLFAESLLLAAAGGAAGLLAAYFGLGLLEWLRPADLPRRSEISMDWTVVLFALGLSALTSLTFGLLPAWWHAWRGPSLALTQSRSQTPTARARRVQTALVVAEVALSIVPLVAAGLMLRTFTNLVNAPIGFDALSLVTARISVNFRQYPDVPSRWRFHRDVLDRIGRLPGVEMVTAAGPLPFAKLQTTRRYGRDDDEGAPLSLATQQTVLPGYLQITQTRLLEGRDFTLHDIDTERPVVIVDERIARQLWPAGAVGRRLAVVAGQRRRVLEVVGVTNAVRSAKVRDDSTPHVFVPYHVYPIELSLVAKTGLSAEAIGPAIERTFAAMGTGRAVFDIRPMSDYVAESIGDTRFAMLVMSGFGIAALLLAVVGLYGTLAYLISLRTREIGVRMALGASAGAIVAMVLREGVTFSAVGVAVGLAGAMALAGVMRGLLYGVSAADGSTFVAVAALVVVTTLVATGRPAARAARIDPTVALRAE